MEKLIINGTGFGPDHTGTVYLTRGTKKLAIDFASNLDLYFTLSNYKNDPTFIISKDNYPVYLIFAKLYQEIISGEVYPFPKEEILKKCELLNMDYHEELQDNEEFYEEDLMHFRYIAKKTGLVKDNIITWISDEYPLEIAPLFKIIKENDNYILKFFNNSNLPSTDDFFLKNLPHNHQISVRIRMSGSRYNPFNACFMRIYDPLMELGLSKFTQIGIEEYLIDKELEKEKNLERILLKK